jgi:hypothetical protein
VTHTTLGDLAHVLRAYGATADIALYRGRWTVHLSTSDHVVVAEHADLETALDAAITAAAAQHEHRRTS